MYRSKESAATRCDWISASTEATSSATARSWAARSSSVGSVRRTACRGVRRFALFAGARPETAFILQSRAGRVTRANPGDFERLIADIEREAYDEGPQAVRELEQLRAEYRTAGEAVAARRRLGNNLGNKLSETHKHSAAETPANRSEERRVGK